MSDSKVSLAFLALGSNPYGEWEEDPTKNLVEAMLAPSFGAIKLTIASKT